MVLRRDRNEDGVLNMEDTERLRRGPGMRDGRGPGMRDGRGRGMRDGRGQGATE